MPRITCRLSREDADSFVEALALESPIGRETAGMVRPLGQLTADEESADFEPEHLNVLARVMVEYEWREASVHDGLRAEVTRLQTE